jgi:hypothetical protein
MTKENTNMGIELIVKALNNLVPNAKWSLVGDDYADLVWLSDGTKPSVADIEKEIAAIPAKEAKAKADTDAKKAALLTKLGITAEEAALLLS